MSITRLTLIERQSGIKDVTFHLKKISLPYSYFIEIEKFWNQHTWLYYEEGELGNM